MFVRRAIALLGSVVALGFLIGEIRSRGPLVLRAPATVVSNGLPPQKASVGYFLCLDKFRPRLQRGDRVSIVSPEYPAPFLIAVGQLPDQVVTSGQSMDATRSNVNSILAYRQTFDDPRFVIVEASGDCSLYRRAR